MQEKKTTVKKVGVNTSSGTRKVKTIEQENDTKKSPTGRRYTSKSQSVTATQKNKENEAGRMMKEDALAEKKTAQRQVAKQVKMENKAAIAREKSAEARAERKALRKMKREEHRRLVAEKRLEVKERIAAKRAEAMERAKERKAAREARRDMLRNETAIQRIARKEREHDEKMALRRQNAELKHELALKRKEERMERHRMEQSERQHKREHRSRRRESSRGVGGWLAAVITLGTASLAMLAVITVGALNLGNLNAGMGATYRSNLYEITELSENLDLNLNKLRVASGENEQRRLLTEILVDSELMEGALERLPMDMMATNNVTSFVNDTASYARQNLTNLARGNAISEEKVEEMYQTNKVILTELQALRDGMDEKDFEKMVNGAKKGVMQEGFDKINAFMDKAKNLPAAKVVKGLSGLEEITPQVAQEMITKYFENYSLKSVEYKGDAVTGDIKCYNFTLKDTRDRETYAQVSKNGGKLVMFDSYEKCMANNFSADKCVEIAKEFLSNHGFENMQAVWLQENGATAILTFAPTQDGVVCYTDRVMVKVCETKGVVVGLEAMRYYQNHGERTFQTPKISQQQGIEAIGKLQPTMARLALIPYEGGEALTYEFNGEYEGGEYFAYIDAMTGEELEMITVINTKQGRTLR